MSDSTSWATARDLLYTRYDDGDDWVVYNPASADIHLLTDSAHRLLQLAAEPVSAEALIQRLALDIGIEADAEFDAATRSAITSMDHAGLLRPIRS